MDIHKFGTIILTILLLALNSGSAQVNWTHYASNPVLRTSSDYCSLDYTIAVEPFVMKEGTTYRMWYFGNAGIEDAISADGIHWYRGQSNPVLSGVRGPCVVRDPSGYKMYYYSGSGSDRAIQLATSVDGYSWTPYPGNPVLVGDLNKWDEYGAFYPYVIYENSTYKLWYESEDPSHRGIGYATSADGIVWTKYHHNPLATLGDSVGQTRVLWSGSRYDMLFTSEQGVGYAWSSDGISWQIYGANPIVIPTGSSWERSHVSASGFVWTGERYEQWYSAEGDPGHWQAGFATAPMDTDLTVAVNSEIPLELPEVAALREAYPNPFNPSSRVTFALRYASSVKIEILDALGRRVSMIVDEVVAPGEHTRTWVADQVASGTYFCRLEAITQTIPVKTYVQTKKLMLVK